MNPTVSVIIPTYNRATLVSEAVESVLRGTVAPLEIIVVDDGSTDDTREALRRFRERVHYIFQPNRGPAAARNVGINAAQGQVLAFLDADDLWLPDSLELRVARMSGVDAPRVVMGLTLRVALHDNSPRATPWAARLFGSALIRRDVFTQIGLLDEALKYGEDMDWFLRLREGNVSCVYLHEVTLWYRVHTDSLMNNTKNAKLYALQVIRKSLARRKDANTGEMRALQEIPDLQELLNIVNGTIE